MALPYLDNPASLDDSTVQELDGLVAKLNTFLGKEHNQQGGHTDITAQSVVVDGPITVRDERQAPASFRRTVALGTQIAITPTPGGTTPWLTVIYDKVEDVRLGQVSGGIYTGPGLRLGPAFAAGGTSPQPWDVVAAAVSTGPALLFGDPVRHDRPLGLVFNVAGNHYELRPNAVALDVWLGTSTGPTNQFARLYLSDGVYQRGRAVAAGDWQDVPYNAADYFGGGGMTWTVDAADQTVRRFMRLGQTLWYHVRIYPTSVGGVLAQNLVMTLPAGLTAAQPADGLTTFYNNSGVLTVGFWTVTAGGNTVNFYAGAGLPNWSAAVNNTGVFANMIMEVTG